MIMLDVRVVLDLMVVGTGVVSPEGLFVVDIPVGVVVRPVPFSRSMTRKFRMTDASRGIGKTTPTRRSH